MVRKETPNTSPIETEIVINVAQILTSCRTEKERREVLQWISLFATMQHAAFNEREKAWHVRAEVRKEERESLSTTGTPAVEMVL